MREQCDEPSKPISLKAILMGLRWGVVWIVDFVWCCLLELRKDLNLLGYS